MKNISLHLFTLLIVLAAGGCKKSSENTPNASDSPASTPASAASTPGSGQSDDPVLLKMQWPVGIRLLQHMDLGQSMNVPMGPGPGTKTMNQEVTFGQDYSLSCLRERDGGGHEVELEFLAANMSVLMGGNE